MADVNVKHIVVGPVMTNCYICNNTDKNEAVIVDPGDEADRIISFINDLGCIPVAIFLTHGHFDHMLAADELRRHYGIKIYAYEAETELLGDEGMNLSIYHGYPTRLSPDCAVTDNEYIETAGMKFKVIYTPGHTRGSCCYLLEDENILFSGDTMFYHSYGRTDFVTGSESAIIHSIVEKLLPLNEDTIVYPGHGESTTIADERLMY